MASASHRRALATKLLNTVFRDAVQRSFLRSVAIEQLSSLPASTTRGPRGVARHQLAERLVTRVLTHVYGARRHAVTLNSCAALHRLSTLVTYDPTTTPPSYR